TCFVKISSVSSKFNRSARIFVAIFSSDFKNSPYEDFPRSITSLRISNVHLSPKTSSEQLMGQFDLFFFMLIGLSTCNLQCLCIMYLHNTITNFQGKK